MPADNIPTPETDRGVYNAITRLEDSDEWVVRPDLARSLERRLAVAVEALEKEFTTCDCLLGEKGNPELGIPPCEKCAKRRAILARIAAMKE